MAGLGAGLAIAFASGPRVNLSYELHAPQLPQDLDAHVRKLENTIPDLVPGTEKTILWANPSRPQRTPLALVYLHGFSATRREISPAGERIAARLGANAFFTRLTGHGRDGAAMAQASVEDLLQDGVEALAIGRRLGEELILVGTSTGATLATWLLANGYAADVAASVWLSPNFGPRNRMSELLLWPWGAEIARLIKGPLHEWRAVNPSQERFWTTSYPVQALPTMMGLVALARASDLSKVRAPLLVLYNPHDRIVRSEAIETEFQRLGSQHKRLHVIDQPGDPQRHVLAGSILSPTTMDEVVALIEEFLASVR